MSFIFNDLNNKNIIITGGLGFLATQFVQAFQKYQCNIILIDIKNSKKTKKKRELL